MTKFEDQLFQTLMDEHGHELRATPQPAATRHRVRRPVWLASGVVGAAAAASAAVLALGSAAPAMAYSVSQHDGAVSVSVANSTGVAGANTALQHLKSRVVIVPVRNGCPSISSLPHPNPAPHLAVTVKTGLKQGHRSVTVKIGGSIPAGDTMILAFSGDTNAGQVGAGGIITGKVPHCVSLPPAPKPPAGAKSGASSGGGISTGTGAKSGASTTQSG